MSRAFAHPTQVVRFQLIATLLGVALTLAIADLTTSFSWRAVIATGAFIVMALNFFHAQVVALADQEYNESLVQRPAIALIDYVLNLIVVLALVFMAVGLQSAIQVVVANIVLRFADLILVFMAALRLHTIKRVHQVWIGIDIGAIVAWIVIAIVSHPGSSASLSVAVGFAAITGADVLIDYIGNRGFYFSTTSDWNHLALDWDAMQGELGDKYRQGFVVPALLAAVDVTSSTSVLDLGCGNGCISRWFARNGAHVLGVDAFETVLRTARVYPGAPIRYARHDLEDTPSALAEGPFDVVLACFALQECRHLDHPMGWIAKNLAPDGVALVVYEDPSGPDYADHSQRRRWLDSRGKNRMYRRQLIFWDPETMSDLQMGPPGDAVSVAGESEAITMVNYMWSADAYVTVAREHHLAPVDAAVGLSPAPAAIASDVMLRRYALRPRFWLLKLRRDDAVPSSPRLT